MTTFWNTIYFNNSVQQWIIFGGFLLAGIILILLFKRLILSRLKRWADRTDTLFDDFIVATFEKSVVPLAYLTTAYFAIQTLTISLRVGNIVHIAFLFSATFFLLSIVTALIRQFIFSFIQKQDDSETKTKQARGLLIIISGIIWILGGVFLIDNLGYNVTTLITGLGIGGIAIALAAQTILGDLFSYFIIFFDRPFEIGDFIVIGDKMGTVEYVGVKTTRIRTLSGEQLICSNTFLTNAQVHNFKRMQERRVVLKLGIVYQSSPELVTSVPDMIREIIESKSEVRFDRGHFSGFGASSLDFEFVYFVLSPDYNFYMDKQQDIGFNILNQFKDKGIEFAYPTQTLYLTR